MSISTLPRPRNLAEYLLVVYMLGKVARTFLQDYMNNATTVLRTSSILKSKSENGFTPLNDLYVIK